MLGFGLAPSKITESMSCIASFSAIIAATPALQLRDRESGKTLLLHGPVEGDALLSAIDLLAAGGTTVAEPAHSADMPTSVAGDMPR